MKISQVIQKLKAIQAEYGDLEVELFHFSDDGDTNIHEDIESIKE